jgi:tagatose kinase
MVNVLTIGELIVEIMRPTVGVPFNRVDTFNGPFPSGAPAIFIYNIGSLGLKSGMVAKVGNDKFGDFCIEHLSSVGINTESLTRGYNPTGVAFVTYDQDKNREFIFHLSNSAAGEVTDFEINESIIQDYNWLHLNGSSLSINEKVHKACVKAAKLIKKNGGTISFDPNLRTELLSNTEIFNICQPILELADYVLPSEGEELIISKKENRDAAIDYLLNLGAKKVFLKLGEKGSISYGQNEEVFEHGLSINEVDPTGAGDSFCAGVVYGLSKGWDTRKTLAFSNGIGALAASTKGPMTWNINEEKVWQFIDEPKNRLISI